MRIIIAGGGKYSERLAESLVREKNNVVVIEKDEARAENIGSSINALVLNGDARDRKILKDAGAENCDILVCMTDSDAANLGVAEAARELGTKRVVSRIADPRDAKDFESLGIPVINITDSVVGAFKAVIDRCQRNTLADIGGGKFHIIERVVGKGSAAIGKKFSKVSKDIIPVAVCRGGKVVAKGGTKVEEDDTLIMCVPREKLKDVEKLF
ncbi:MAG: NAD-binding protein [Candidatus Aenigmarchaeota archaeon]|nr:NAD-binding protein [Candidatus Aenigmarchaeota archaeon]